MIVKKLSDKQKQVCISLFEQGYSIKEVASSLQVDGRAVSGLYNFYSYKKREQESTKDSVLSHKENMEVAKTIHGNFVGVLDSLKKYNSPEYRKDFGNRIRVYTAIQEYLLHLLEEDTTYEQNQKIIQALKEVRKLRREMKNEKKCADSLHVNIAIPPNCKNLNLSKLLTNYINKVDNLVQTIEETHAPIGATYRNVNVPKILSGIDNGIESFESFLKKFEL